MSRLIRLFTDGKACWPGGELTLDFRGEGFVVRPERVKLRVELDEERRAAELTRPARNISLLKS